ncbi:MAG: hypothetical protein P4N59_08510 [Negativicutes bacterium]|nr:hypothetical protein [Negativicutes bacterium]
MDEKIANQWQEFLDPKILKPKLICASLFLAAFEVLKESIIGRLQSFYSFEWDQSGPIESEEYKVKVLSRSKSRLYASLGWLKENGVIDDADLALFETIKTCRNEVAHEIPGLAMGKMSGRFAEHFADVVSLIRKVEVWWIVNVEIPTNPDFDGDEINEDEITPGPLLSIQMMIEIALGADDESNKYINEFQKLKQ